jgi:hypothetical protein
MMRGPMRQDVRDIVASLIALAALTALAAITMVG